MPLILRYGMIRRRTPQRIANNFGRAEAWLSVKLLVWWRATASLVKFLRLIFAKQSLSYRGNQPSQEGIMTPLLEIQIP